MKKDRKIWKIVTTLIVVFSLAYYLNKNSEIFQDINNLSIKDILLVSFLNILMIASYAILNKKMMDKIDKNVSYSDSFLMQYANNFLNKILPKGGTVFRGLYLKKRYRFPYSKFLATVGGLYIVTFVSYSMIGLISLLYIYLDTGIYNLLITFAFLGLLAGTLFIILFNPKLNRERGKLFKAISEVLDGWKAIKRYPLDIFIFTLINLLVLLFNTLKIFFLYNSLGLEIDFIRGLYLSSISVITMFINITPDGIGVNEAIYAFSSDVINISPEGLVFGSMISRIITVLSSFLLGGISYIILLRRVEKE